MMSEKRILLTGGNGFIGRNILEQLKNDYQIFAPSSKELDLLDQEAVRQYLQSHDITDVIHAAVYNQKRRDQNPEADLSSNLKMFYHLAEHADHFNKMIYFGSGAEFDKRFPIHMAREQDFGRTIPMLNDYSFSKYIMNMQARNSRNIYNLRLFGVFGKYENSDTCFLSHLCRCAQEGRPLTIRQECLFDFISVDDIMPPLRWVLENKPKYHDYNLCSGRPVLLSEIAEMVREISGKNLEMVFLKQGENMEYTGSCGRLQQELILEQSDIRQKIKKLYNFRKLTDHITGG